jgi:hypothetical protein
LSGRILAKHISTEARKVPSIAAKGVSPHVLLHTCAIIPCRRPATSGKSRFGSDMPACTEVYLRADPTEKLETLAAMAPPILKPGRFHAPTSFWR